MNKDLNDDDEAALDKLWEGIRNDLKQEMNMKNFNEIYASPSFSKEAELVANLRRVDIPKMMAELASIQPMGGNLFADLLANASDENELREAGFEPVSHVGLMWHKKSAVEEGLE
jgi:hypothetical protein